MYKRILVANRGEIASRAINTFKELGLETVSIYSQEDRMLHYINEADYAYCVGSGTVNETYKNYEMILKAVKETASDAIYFAYGFLAEDSVFIQKCIDSGLNYIGTNLDFCTKVKDKLLIKETANSFDIAVCPGPLESFSKIEDVYTYFDKTKKAFFIKPRYGEFAKAIKLIKTREKIEKIFNLYEIETSVHYRSSEFIIEEDLSNAKHIEVPVIRDCNSNVMVLPEINSTIKRWHKTIVSETPAAFISDVLRSYLVNASKLLAEKLDLIGYATFEFLVYKNKAYLLEVNPRLNVEFGITEMVTGVDIIKQQLLISSASKMELSGKDLQCRGYSVQARIYAENPYTFSPTPGFAKNIYIPHLSGIRNELTVQNNWPIPVQYDHMLAKVSSYARTKEQALIKLKIALNNYVFSGLETNIPLLKDILNDEEFISNSYNLNYIKKFAKKQHLVDASNMMAILSALAIKEAGSKKIVINKNSSWRDAVGTGRF